jgi:hypothetical protein
VRRLLPLLTLLAVVTPATAHGDALLPPKGKVFAGVAMGEELSDFTRRSGRKPAVWEQFVAFHGGYSWAIRLAEQHNTRVMLALSTAPSQDQPGTISPGAIADGGGDRWLVAVRRSLGRFGRPAYLRFLGEMNNCHNAYAPLHCNGSSRGQAYSAATFIRAWKRVATIMRGTSTEQINGELRRAGLRTLRADAGNLPPAQIAMVWTPMTGGSPLISSLDPSRFWPGRRWVDWVGTSFYSKFPNWGYLNSYYRRFAVRFNKPFMFAEWAMWINGNPGFVNQLMSWTHSHRRTRMLVYNQGKRTDGPFRLYRFPAAAAALRRGLNSRRFNAR